MSFDIDELNAQLQEMADSVEAPFDIDVEAAPPEVSEAALEDVNAIAARAAEDFVPITEPLRAAELPTAGQSPLTAEQLEAVRHLEGPGLVVAGPGSGKTTVLRERLRHLVQERGVEARSILSLAYNRAAKQELIRRTQAIGDFEIDTLHGFAYKIVRENADRLGYAQPPGLVEESLHDFVSRKLSLTATTPREVQSIVREIERAKQQVTQGVFEPTVLPETFTISARQAIEGVAPVGTARAMGTREVPLRALAQEYENLKRTTGTLDFQDMLIRAGHLLESDPAIREIYQARFPYVQIDEFQDVSPADWRLVRSLSENLLAVGDDDQAIYGSMRGGTGGVMRDFSERAARYEIARNFRSTPEIVDASRAFIESGLSERLPKELVSGRESIGTPIRHISASQHDVIQRLTEEIERGGEIAVLLRENAEIDWFRDQLAPDLLEQVEFSTIHSAKGREWERVLLPLNVTERGGERYRSLPSPHASSLAEEQNLLYVAMTRAKNELTVLGDEYEYLFPRIEDAVAEGSTRGQQVADDVVEIGRELNRGWRGLFHRFRAHYQRIRAYQDMVRMEKDIPDVDVYENLSAADVHREKIEELGRWLGLEPAARDQRPTRLRAIDRLLTNLGNPRRVFLSHLLANVGASQFGLLGQDPALWSMTGITNLLPFATQRLSHRMDRWLYPEARRPTFDLNLDYGAKIDHLPQAVRDALTPEELQTGLDDQGELRNWRAVHWKDMDTQFDETFYEFPHPEQGWEGSYLDRPLYTQSGARMTRVTMAEMERLNEQGIDPMMYTDLDTTAGHPSARIRDYAPYGWSGDPFVRPSRPRPAEGLVQPSVYFLERIRKVIEENRTGTREPHRIFRRKFWRSWHRNHKKLLKRIDNFNKWYEKNIAPLQGPEAQRAIQTRFLPRLDRLLSQLYPRRSRHGDESKHAIRLGLEGEDIERDLHKLHTEVLDVLEKVWDEDSPYHQPFSWLYARSGPFALPDGAQSELTRGAERADALEGRQRRRFRVPELRLPRLRLPSIGIPSIGGRGLRESAVRLRVSDTGGERISSGVYLGDGRIAVTLHQIVDEIDKYTGELLRPKAIEATGLGRRGRTADVVGVEGYDIENELAILRLAEDADIGARAAPIAQGSAVAGERLRGIGVTARRPDTLFGYRGRFGQVGRFASSLLGRPIKPGVSGAGVFNRFGELVGLSSAGLGERTFMRSASALQGIMGDDYQSLPEFLEGVPNTRSLFADLGIESGRFGAGVGLSLGREDAALLRSLFGDQDGLLFEKEILERLGDKRSPADDDRLVGLNRLIEGNQREIDRLQEKGARSIPRRTDRAIRSLLGERERISEFHYGARPEELEAILASNTDVLSGYLDPSLRGDIGKLRPDMFTRSYRAGQRVAQALESPHASAFQRTGARSLSAAVNVLEPLIGTGGLVSRGVRATAGAAKAAKASKVGRFLTKGAKFGGLLLSAAEVAEVFEIAAYVSGARERQIHEGVLGMGRYASQDMANFVGQLQQSPELLEIMRTGVLPGGLSEQDIATVEKYQEIASGIRERATGAHSDLIKQRDVLSSELLYIRELQAQGKNPYASRTLAPFSAQSPLEKDYLKRESEEFFGFSLGPLSHVIRFFDTIEKLPSQRVWHGWKDPRGEQHIAEVQKQLAEVEGVLETAGLSGIEESEESRQARLSVLKDRFESNEAIMAQVREELEPRTLAQDVRERGASRARSIYMQRGAGIRDPRAISEARAGVLRSELADNERHLKLILGSYGVNVEDLDDLGFGGLDRELNKILSEQGKDYYDNTDALTFAKRFMGTAFRSGDTQHVFPELRNAVNDALRERIGIQRELSNLPTEQLKNLEDENETLTDQIQELEPTFTGRPDTSMGLFRAMEMGRSIKADIDKVVSEVPAVRPGDVGGVVDVSPDSQVLAARPDSVLAARPDLEAASEAALEAASGAVSEAALGSQVVPYTMDPKYDAVRKEIHEAVMKRAGVTVSRSAEDTLKARDMGSYVVIKDINDIVDGDTVRGLIHHAGEARKGQVRFKGFDAPEMDPGKKWRYDPQRPQAMLDRERGRAERAKALLRDFIMAANPGKTSDFVLPLEMLEGVWEHGKFGRVLGTPVFDGADFYRTAIDLQLGRKYGSKVDLGGEFVDTTKARYTDKEWNAAQRFREDLVESQLKEALERQQAAIGLPGELMEQRLSFLLGGGVLPGDEGTYKSRLEGFQETARTQIEATQKRVLREQKHVAALRDRFDTRSDYALSQPTFLPEHEKYLGKLKAEVEAAESKLEAEEDLLKQLESVYAKGGRTLDQLYREIAKSEKYIVEAGRRSALAAAQEFVTGVSDVVTDHTQRRSLLPSGLVLDTDFVAGLEGDFREGLADESDTVDEEIKKWSGKVESQKQIVRKAEEDRLGLEKEFKRTGDLSMKTPEGDLTKAQQAESAAQGTLKYNQQQLKFYERTRDYIDQAVIKSKTFEDRSVALAHAEELSGVAEAFGAYRGDVGDAIFDIRDSQKGIFPLTAYSEEAIKNITGRVHPLTQQWADQSRVNLEGLQVRGQEGIAGLDAQLEGQLVPLPTGGSMRVGGLRQKLAADEAKLEQLNKDIIGRRDRGEELPESLLQEAQGLDKSVQAQQQTIAKLEGIRERYMTEQERLTAALTQIRVALEKHAQQLQGLKENIKYKSVSQMLREGLTPAEIDEKVTGMLSEMSEEERSKYVAANKSALMRIDKQEKERELAGELARLPFPERFEREKELQASTRGGAYEEWKRQHLQDQRLQEREMRRQNNEVLRRCEYYSQLVARVPFQFAESLWTRSEIGARGDLAQDKLKIDHLEQVRRVQDDMYLSAEQKEKQLQTLRRQYARERMKIEEEVGKAQSDVLNNVWKDFLKGVGSDLWGRAQNRFAGMVEGWLWGKPTGGGHTGQPSNGGVLNNLIGSGIDKLFGTGAPQGGSTTQGGGGSGGGFVSDVASNVIGDAAKEKAGGWLKDAWNWGKGVLGFGGGGTAAAEVGSSATSSVLPSSVPKVSSIIDVAGAPSVGSTTSSTASSAGGSSVLSSVGHAIGPLVVAEVGIGALQGEDTGGKPTDVLAEIGKTVWGGLGDIFSFDNPQNDMVARRVGARLAQRQAMTEARKMGHRSAMDLLTHHAKGFVDESKQINNVNNVTNNVSGDSEKEDLHLTVNVYENDGGRQKLKQTHRSMEKLERQKVVRKNKNN